MNNEMSLILFDIFIMDLNTFFKDRGIIGVVINHLVNTILLVFAAGIVIFAGKNGGEIFKTCHFIWEI